MRRISRRLFLSASSAAAALPLIRSARLDAQVEPVFRHGVASGDPLTDRVMLWTRVSLPRDTASVSWVMARDPKFARIVARGEQQTGASRDFTVKVDVGGLEPGTTYYYRFEAAKAQSAIGRTRTLPARGVARIRLGVASCSNYPFGYFNAYAALARPTDLDAVLHLGDYIYEYANGGYGDGTAMGRVPEPNHEILALADYRARHAQHRRIPTPRRSTASIRSSWSGTTTSSRTTPGRAARGPQSREGGRRLVRPAERRHPGLLRVDADSRGSAGPQPLIYRTLSFGDLADLVMLDTRWWDATCRPPRRDDVASIESPTRSLLGPAQDAWLRGELAESKRNGARWQLIGQQVMFAPQAPARAADQQRRLMGRLPRGARPRVRHDRRAQARQRRRPHRRRAQLVGLRPATAALRQLRSRHRPRLARRRVRRHLGHLLQHARHRAGRRGATAWHPEVPTAPALRGRPLPSATSSSI